MNARAALLSVLLALLAACRSGSTFERHAHVAPWIEGIGAQAEDPWQWGAEVTLTALVPVAAVLDQQIANEAPEDAFFSGGNTALGDTWAAALGVAPLILGAWNWSVGEGDGGRAFEVAGESLLATLVTTQTLKYATGRTRPDESNDDSFPSGHTSWAFAGATYIGRYVDHEYDSKLGYLAWLPATYVGINRLEGNKHWASDVAVGALLGTFLTNAIWNAHYGPSEHALFDSQPATAWRVTPFGDGQALGLSLTASW